MEPVTLRRYLAPLAPWIQALAGAVCGYGCIALIAVIGLGIFSLVGAIALEGAALSAVMVWRFGARSLWAFLVGFGLAPAAILVFDIVTAPPPCPSQPANVSYACGHTPPGQIYIYMAIGFLAIALIGALIPLAPRITRALRSGNAHPNDAI